MRKNSLYPGELRLDLAVKTIHTYAWAPFIVIGYPASLAKGIGMIKSRNLVVVVL
jgi:hypothetical protein